jgi:hypothetical protein
MAITPTANGYVDSGGWGQLADGMLQGHHLGLQILAERRAQQQFLTQQAMENQKMSMQDIMNHQILDKNSVPVSAMGTVDNPAGPSIPSNVPGVPATPGNPAYTRKADSSRVISYQGQKRELKTPEQQQQFDLGQQVNSQNALEEAKIQAQADAQYHVRQNTMKLEGGGIPAQGLGIVGVPDGTLLTRQEAFQYNQAADERRRAGLVTLTPGSTLVDTLPTAGAAAPGGSPAPGGQAPLEPIAQPPRAPVAGLPANLQPKTPVGAPGQPVPASAQPGAAPGGGARVIATGGPPVPTGEFATVYLPKYAAARGKTVAQLGEPDVQDALSKFKEANTDPEEKASRLAARASEERARQFQQSFETQTHQDALDRQNKERGDKSYALNSGQLQKMGKPIDDTVQRYSRVREALDQNDPFADAAVGPEVIGLITSGQSGTRMSPALIDKVMGGKGKLQELQTAVNKWRLDPKSAGSITPEQRQMIRTLADAIGQKAIAKQQLLNDADWKLKNSTDPDQHRQILGGVKRDLDAMDTQQQGAVPPEVQQVLKAATPGVHKLSDGSTWMKGADGTITKQ